LHEFGSLLSTLNWAKLGKPNVNTQFIEDQLAADVTTPSDDRAENPQDPAGLSAFLPTPDAMEAEIASVMEIKLNDNLHPWVEGYSKVGHRNPFLWNWCRRGVEVTMLSCVEPSLQDAVCDTRVLGIMLDVLLDDIADHLKDLAFLEQLLGVMETGVRPEVSAFAPHQQAYATFTMDVWDEIQRRIRQFPRYQEFAELLRFDYRQLFNVMRYSRLLNEYPEMFNLVEHDLYTPHNMHMMISATMDLMCSPAFDRSELALLREVVWRAQCMGRIGNLVTTWQREIGENDFTSGVFARAISCGDLFVSDLWSGNRAYLETVIKRQEHEEYFLRRWQAYRREMLAMRSRARTVNVSNLVAGLQRLICLHLGSRGKK
jgi:hypothetical protein